MDNSNERYLNWLTAQIGFNYEYHNHKETMAWVATAFYVPAIIALTLHMPNASTFWEIFCTVALFVFLAFLISAFVFTQFWLRSRASDEIIALQRIVNNLCKNTEYEPKDFEMPREQNWPLFVQNEINLARGKGRLMFTKWSTDGITYLVIAISTIIGLAFALK
jgi:hypothetical protein